MRSPNILRGVAFLLSPQPINASRSIINRNQKRIVQLDSGPDFARDGLSSRSHSEFVEGRTLVEMIKEDLVAERIAIDSYREMIASFGAFDPTTRKTLKEITVTEEEHADDVAELLQNLLKDSTT